jgi:hypothetical protein
MGGWRILERLVPDMPLAVSRLVSGVLRACPALIVRISGAASMPLVSLDVG